MKSYVVMRAGPSLAGHKISSLSKRYLVGKACRRFHVKFGLDFLNVKEKYLS